MVFEPLRDFRLFRGAFPWNCLLSDPNEWDADFSIHPFVKSFTGDKYPCSDESDHLSAITTATLREVTCTLHVEPLADGVPPLLNG